MSAQEEIAQVGRTLELVREELEQIDQRKQVAKQHIRALEKRAAQIDRAKAAERFKARIPLIYSVLVSLVFGVLLLLDPGLFGVDQ